MNYVAILSSTVLPLDGDYKVETVPFPTTLTGTPHYVGHPNTKSLLEALGAVPATERLFGGQQVGDVVLAVPLATNTRDGGWTKDVAVTSVGELKARRVTRIG